MPGLHKLGRTSNCDFSDKNYYLKCDYILHAIAHKKTRDDISICVYDYKKQQQQKYKHYY